ncbi:transglycosylase SLT domain-containing protein [Frigoribacterium sp. 2-23]|uniref:aggregation-promoting factor C-terminal-like domain-containing protein n=1 Tax=Frigoribacterium sp. 2-23 TaxID=3415006 RepID=UPI003C705BCE
MGRHSAISDSGTTHLEHPALVRRTAPAQRRLVPASQLSVVGRPPVASSRRGNRYVLPLVGFCASFAFVSASLINPLSGAEAATTSTGAAAALVAPGQSFSVDSGVAVAAADRDTYGVTEYVAPPPPVVVDDTASSTKTASGTGAGATAKKSSSAPVAGTPDPGSAKAVAADMVAAKGWGTGEYDCLVSLFNKESGWNVYAYNPSGAYGIPQALPGSKMAAFGADWQTNPATQIAWGLSYIEGRYKTPCGAWAHSQSVNWY